MTVIVALFAAISSVTPFATILPAYRVPAVLADASQTALTAFSTSASNGSLELIRAEVMSEAIQPEDYVFIQTDWRVEETLHRDWSLFVHLVTPDGVIVSQRDIYPAQGLLATSDLAPGTLFANPVAVRAPLTAYTPMQLQVEVGWYHLLTGERLNLPDGAETYRIGVVELQALEGDFPNPVAINFGDIIELAGYQLTDIAPSVGDTVELTLYWRGLSDIEIDYKVFANILDPQTLTKYAASDGMPAQWAAPTSTWQRGQIVEDIHTLHIGNNAPPGIYELELGLYQETLEGFPRLRIHTADGGQADNFVYLSRVRILPAEERSGE